MHYDDLNDVHRYDLTQAGQKAPSAKRCIKTDVSNRVNQVSYVRKHRAPNGALRLCPLGGGRLCGPSQKAPSAKRCIKTIREHRHVTRRSDRSESTERQKVH